MMRAFSATGIGGEACTIILLLATDSCACIESLYSRHLTKSSLPLLNLLNLWNVLSMFSDMISWRSPMEPAGLEAWSSSSGCSEIGCSSGRCLRGPPSLSSAVTLKRVWSSFVDLWRCTRLSSSSFSLLLTLLIWCPSSERAELTFWFDISSLNFKLLTSALELKIFKQQQNYKIKMNGFKTRQNVVINKKSVVCV